MTTVRLNESEYYEKAYGAWLGKNIGGTLGEPVEGRKELLDLDFYPELPAEFDTTDIDHYPDSTDEGEPTPLANDDLDLQLIWLHALEQYGPAVRSKELGQEWLDHVFFPYNEYRYALANLRRGLRPPVAGWFNNQFYNDCMGSPIRSEIWALVAPGEPALATRYAYEDAIVDHAGGEGVHGELFNAAIESAAFVEDDPNRLIDVGLSYVPEDSRIANVVRDTVSWYDDELDWRETRERILDAYGHPDMTNAPQNIGFVILGWLYGDDFGDALLKCVNCGYDTDSSGATIGSLLGILAGRSGIPDRWIEPIGTAVVTRPQVRGFPAPNDLEELTDRTLSMARTVLEFNDASVEIVADAQTRPTDEPRGRMTEWTDATNPRALWERDPTTNTYYLPEGSRSDPSIVVTVSYGDGEPAIGKGESKTLTFTIENASNDRWYGTLGLDLPVNWQGPEKQSYSLAAGETTEWQPTVTADRTVRPNYDLELEIERLHDGSPWDSKTVPFSLVAATHWRVEGPMGERELVRPDNRIDLSNVVNTSPGDLYTARSTLVNSRERTIQLEVHTATPATVSVDGDELFETEASNDPDMLAGTRWMDGGKLDLSAGEHDLEIKFRATDRPVTAYVIPAATAETKEPGEYYFVTDVLFT